MKTAAVPVSELVTGTNELSELPGEDLSYMEAGRVEELGRPRRPSELDGLELFRLAELSDHNGK